MNLIIDIGNTTAKAALFNGNDIVEERRYGSLTTADTESILTDHPHIEAAILCSVGSYDKGVDELLSGSIARFVQFGAETPVPIGNAYATPATLGSDRLAAAVLAFQGPCRLYRRSPSLLFAGWRRAAGRKLYARGHRSGGGEGHNWRDSRIYRGESSSSRRRGGDFYRRRCELFCRKVKKYDICKSPSGRDRVKRYS